MRLAIGLLGLCFVGCASQEDIFVDGRIENRCNESIPSCGFQAGCILRRDQFLRGRFPGGQRLIVRTESTPTRLILRALLLEQTFSGSEFFVRAYDTDCGAFDEAIRQDVDLFDLAGGDAILEEPLDVEGRGDHLIEVFSDMGAEFRFLVEQEE